LTPPLTLEQILEWLDADDGEPELGLSAREHATQAAEFALATGDDELVAAALLHDLGHAEYGHDHGRWARDTLADCFSERVIWLIEHHITAKRYACWADPDYYLKLSADSKRTLALQGGPLDAEAAGDFASHPLFDQVMRLREWDEASKHGGVVPRPVEAYWPHVERAMRTMDSA
jgi:predicted HD phosphohydrolase